VYRRVYHVRGGPTGRGRLAGTRPIPVMIRRVTEEWFRTGSLSIFHDRVGPGHLLQRGTAVIAVPSVVPTRQQMAGLRPAMTGWGKPICLAPLILMPMGTRPAMTESHDGFTAHVHYPRLRACRSAGNRSSAAIADRPSFSGARECTGLSAAA
jgi:hypothetical protein